VRFDSTEYWQANTWDRYVEVAKVPQAIKDEFLRQEELTVSGILPLCNKESDLRIMDLACGAGRVAESVLQAASFNRKVLMTLVDFNPKTIVLAKQNLKNYHNVSFAIADAYDIGNMLDGSFDMVICLDLLHHISDVNSLFSQIKKVLKPNGLFIGNVLAAETYAEWDRLKYGRIKSWRRRLLCSLSQKVYRTSPRAVKRVIRRLGLARLTPFAREDLLASLEAHFESVEIITSYYHWFCARTVR
jgi:ubiquinone/menaquinone biosynthesis C-methylase UbiE